MEQERLFAQIAHALDAELVGSAQLEGGSSANVWRLDLDRGQGAGIETVVFRQHPPGDVTGHSAGIARKEFQLLERLLQLGFPVAAPRYLDDQHRCLVTEFVGGDSFVDPTALTSALDQMVDLLVRLHALDVSSLAGIDLTNLENPIERLRSCLPDSSNGRRLGALLDSDAFVVHLNPTVLIHGDYWPGNVLWNHGRLAALIDWEDAWLGDPLADLACARVELLCQFGRPAMEHFTDRYLDQAPRLDIRSLPLWECYVSATALASMHLWGLDAADEAQRRSLTRSFFDRAVTMIAADSPG